MLSPGAVLDDRYRLTDHLATGGMGEVWRAVDTVLGRTVAIKVLLPALLAEPGFGARFEAEARMMAGLRHPGIVTVFDYGESDLPNGARAVYLVMEYVHGEPLAARLKRDGRLDAATTMAVVAQAADALHAAHLAGIVHRDVKPGNLLMEPDDTVRLVDFGVARSASAARITGTNNVVGTALYMAPEQVAGRTVSPATDIYALGAVAYHCLAGHPPFGGGNPLEVAVKHLHEEAPPLPADVAPPVAALVARALAKDPADRFPTADDLAVAARTVLGEHVDPAASTVPAGVPPAGVPPAAAGPAGTAAATTAALPAAGAGSTTTRARRRSPATAWTAAGLIVAAAIAGVVAFTSGANAPTDGDRPRSVPAPSDQRSGTTAGPATAGPGNAASGTRSPGASSTPAGSASPDTTSSASAGPARTSGSSVPPGGASPGPSSSAQAQPSAPASPSRQASQSPQSEPTPNGSPGGGGVAGLPSAGGATSPPSGGGIAVPMDIAGPIAILTQPAGG